MKISTDKYLINSSVFAVFSEAFMVRFIIDLKLLYFIILINLFLIIKLNKLKINVYFVTLLLLLFCHGLIVNVFIGIPPNYLLSQIIGIGIVGLYFYNIIKIYGINVILKTYLKMTFWIAVIGYPLYILNNFFFITLFKDPRFHSVLTEPAHYVVVVFPACYYFFKTKEYKKFFVLFGTLILTESSLAILGFGLMVLLPNINLKRLAYLFGVIPIFVGVFYLVYINNEKIKVRFDDTYESFNAINNGKFDKTTNLSTYALISNLYVAKSNFIDHPFGSGLGSHYYMYIENYFTTLRTPDYIKTLKLDKLNSNDAASLFIRMFSELGIFGLLIIVYFIYKSSVVFFNKTNFLGQGIFIYILLKLFRDGHYFPPELFFFIWLMYFSIKNKVYQLDNVYKITK